MMERKLLGCPLISVRATVCTVETETDLGLLVLARRGHFDNGRWKALDLGSR